MKKTHTQPLPPRFFTQNKVDTVYTQTSETNSDPLLTKFTGICHIDFGYHFVQTKTQNLLTCSPLEAGVLKQTYAGKLKPVKNKEEWRENMTPFLKRTRVGINESFMTLENMAMLKKEFPQTKWVNVAEALRAERKIKTKEEIATLKIAVKITLETIEKIPNFLKKGITEVELAGKIDYEISRAGCQNSFPTIVAFGKNTRNIHHFNSNQKLTPRTLVLTDLGAKFHGYCADITRTQSFGRATREQHETYAKCARALDECIDMIRPGKKASELMTHAENVLGEKMPHALGHGIGLETHDVPGGISTRAEWACEEGMMLAVEPGHYGKHFGIRIEENVEVTRKGNQQLSKAPKKLLEH